MLDFQNYQTQLIGTGIRFPEPFDDSTGRAVTASGLDKINNSILHILGTPIGTRFFLPEFGSRLYELVFEPNDSIFSDLAVLYIKDALNKWEPRINNINVYPMINEHDNHVPIKISYKLINTNIVGNFVYPFNRDSYEIGSFKTIV